MCSMDRCLTSQICLVVLPYVSVFIVFPTSKNGATPYLAAFSSATYHGPPSRSTHQDWPLFEWLHSVPTFSWTTCRRLVWLRNLGGLWPMLKHLYIHTPTSSFVCFGRVVLARGVAESEFKGGMRWVVRSAHSRRVLFAHSYQHWMWPVLNVSANLTGGKQPSVSVHCLHR